jgi:hypothetical protein
LANGKRERNDATKDKSDLEIKLRDMVKLNEEQNKAAEEKYEKAVMAYERKVSDLNKEKEEQEKR